MPKKLTLENHLTEQQLKRQISELSTFAGEKEVAGFEFDSKRRSCQSGCQTIRDVK
jgi:hypothetical protein